MAWKFLGMDIAPTIYDAVQMASKVFGHNTQTVAAEVKSSGVSSQQVTSDILPTLDDEAIVMAVDAAFERLHGEERLDDIKRVRESLDPPQQDAWREAIGKMKQSARSENVVISETITRNRGEPDQPDPALPQRRRGAGRDQERVDRKFDRHPLNYELTADDSRVMHLLTVSNKVRGLNGSVQNAKEYLLSARFIKKQSSAQQAEAAAKQSTQAMANTINRFVGGVRSDEAELVRIDAALKADPPPSADMKQNLERQRNTYLAQRSREANAARKEKDRAATIRIRLYIFGFVVLVIIGITFA